MYYILLFSILNWFSGEKTEGEKLLDLSITQLSISLDSAEATINRIDYNDLDTDGMAMLFYIKADIEFKRKKQLKSLIYYLESLRYATDAGNSDLIHSMNKNIGHIFYDYSNYELSIKFYNEALVHTKDPDKIGRIYYNLGFSYKEKKAYDRSIEYFDKAYDLVESDNMKYRVLNYMGHTLTMWGKYDSAATILETARLMPTSNTKSTIHNLGVNEMYQGNEESAMDYFLQTLDLQPDNFITYKLLGEMLDDVAYLKEAERLYSDQRIQYRNIEIFYDLAKLTGEAHYLDKYKTEMDLFYEERTKAEELLKREHTAFILEAYEQRIDLENSRTYWGNLFNGSVALGIVLMIAIGIGMKARLGYELKKDIEKILND